AMIRQEKKSSKMFGITRWDVAAAASFLLLLVALGCGKEEKRVSAITSEARGQSVVASPAATAAATNGEARTAVASGAAETEGSGLQEEATGETPSVESDAALPPEVILSAPDSLAVPGSIVEITAEGSADVTGITLSDGRGQTRPFVYDAAANVWRASYRVPLRSATERLGISATATNGGNRWKRVWIFLDVLPKQSAVTVDSSQGS
ncbi:MAG TPA: hypothetical protein VI198_04020, partial [Candidatus Eisenbacteria bacterium]